MDCIIDNSRDKIPDMEIQKEIQRIAFLLVMKKPKDYPFTWRGNTVYVANLLPGPKLRLITLSQAIDSTC